MPKLCNMFWCLLAIVVLVIEAAAPSAAARPQQGASAHMDLAVSFDTGRSLLSGSARLTLPAGEGMRLFLPELDVTAALLTRPGRDNLPLRLKNDVITLPAAEQQRTVLLSYEKVVSGTGQNGIGPEAIVLTANWHPLPDRRITYSLSARVPPGFTAISESDALPDTSPDGSARFDFSQPVYSLTFAAAPYIKTQRKVREGLFVYTLFLPEEQALAAGYLADAVSYITRYEELIGPYPYNHYAIVENLKPTGLGLPTFTLLGRQVIRLPFIRSTSLGHEILHSWFGNSIDIAPGSANWCEGLTTYLADMAFRQERGEGAAARKETIQSYLSYVTPATPPLADFTGVGHDRVTNRAERNVGYGRSAMLFHELRRRIGDVSFWRAVRSFYKQFRGSAASWEDLRTHFEQAAGTDLATFFNQRLNAVILPELAIEDVTLKAGSEHVNLSFTLKQLQEPLYDIQVPLVLDTASGHRPETISITQEQTNVTMELDATPFRLSIDPQYDIMRHLGRDERAPIWSDLMADSAVLVVLAPDQEERFKPFLELAGQFGWKRTDSDSLTAKELMEHPLIFLGTTGAWSRGLFAAPQHPPEGFTLDIRHHPLAAGKTIALISSSSSAETAAVTRRLRHYGKYSYLQFHHGLLREKKISTGSMGITVTVEREPSGFPLDSLHHFDELVDELARYRVVYIGETHTSRADHLLQAMLIEALYQRNKDLAIGMEMFPASSQPALDSYISGAGLSEADFLKQSRYNQVWGYDYRLFRPIFAFARQNRIPVVGLNLDRTIVNAVYKSGTVAGLDDEQRETVPLDRDLDLPGYRERLAATFAFHGDGTVGDGSGGSLAGFIQAQSLWDETMAEAIAAHLDAHPGRNMVVLAGSQHTRKDSGIPPRVARRVAVSQAVVTNLATSMLDADALQRTSDYLVMLEAGDFPPAGKIGIVLEERQRDESTELIVIEINAEAPAADAGLMVNDRLEAIEGQAVSNMEDVRLAMLGRTVGEQVVLTVTRPGDSSEEERRIEVRLFDPSPVRPHP